LPGDQYIGQLLINYTVPTGPGSAAMKAFGVIVPRLKVWANRYLNAVGPSGSFAKGTGVLGTTDLDIFISVKKEAPENLEQTYESLYAFAQNEIWIPQRQNVSIGINWLGSKIDLVPGKQQANSPADHSLWKNKQHTWRQTNVAVHITTILNSGRLNEIRALKIWRKCHGLDFPSFYLELTVINALWGKKKNDLANHVWASLEYLRDQFERACVIDPANTANTISDDLTAAEKKKIANAAAESLKKKNWGEVLW